MVNVLLWLVLFIWRIHLKAVWQLLLMRGFCWHLLVGYCSPLRWVVVQEDRLKAWLRVSIQSLSGLLWQDATLQAVLHKPLIFSHWNRKVGKAASCCQSQFPIKGTHPLEHCLHSLYALVSLGMSSQQCKPRIELGLKPNSLVSTPQLCEPRIPGPCRAGGSQPVLSGDLWSEV